MITIMALAHYRRSISNTLPEVDYCAAYFRHPLVLWRARTQSRSLAIRVMQTTPALGRGPQGSHGVGVQTAGCPFPTFRATLLPKDERRYATITRH